MLKKFATTLVGLGAIFSFNASNALDIAVVDIQLAILNSAFGQEQLNLLNNNAEFAEMVATARSLQADIDGMDAQAQAEASAWTNERFQQYTRNRQFKVADLNLNLQKIESERERVVTQIIELMNDAAIGALQEIIDEQDINLLLRASAVWEASDSHNVTQALADKLSQ